MKNHLAYIDNINTTGPNIHNVYIGVRIFCHQTKIIRIVSVGSYRTYNKITITLICNQGDFESSMNCKSYCFPSSWAGTWKISKCYTHIRDEKMHRTEGLSFRKVKSRYFS